ncbi:MAG: cation:proton antiporter, partial [Candidatus Micrarchaeota archaeon]|nr:cation:proton antiporter [Candidatus Micrarchaeota archaeon]
AVLAVAFLVVLRILNKTLDWVTRYQAEETMLFLGLALAIGFSYLAQQVGLTSSIGAFLAGSLVASLPKGKILEHSLAPFALAFTAIFFVSIGLSVNLQSLADHAVLVVVFSVLGAAYRFFGAGTAMYLNGFSSQSAAFSGLAMMSAGEFSLVIAGTGAAAVAAFDLVSVTGGIVFISTLLMSISVPRHEAVHRHLSALMPASLDRAAKRSAAALVAIVNAFATLPKTARENIHDFKWNLAIASVIVAAMAVGLWLARRVEVNVFGATVQGYVLILATGGLLLLPFLLRIADEGYQVLSQVERKTRNASASNWMAAVGFVLLLLIVPFALRHAGRELLLGEIVLLVLVLCAIFYILNLKTPNAKSKSIFLRDPRWKNSAGEKTISRPEHRWKR